MSEAESKRRAEVTAWLEERTAQELLGHAQALFYTAVETQGGIQEVIATYTTPEGERSSFTLHVKDHDLVTMELFSRVDTLVQEVEALANHIEQMTDSD